MTVESRIVLTAEDRTRAAFAAIERNTAKTAMAMSKLAATSLKLAGVGSLIAFLKRGAESTEKWRDEMARLDEITDKFFNTAADAGRIDPLIKVIKGAHTTLFGFATMLDNLGLKIGAGAAAMTEAVKGNFAEASRIMQLYRQDAMQNTAQFLKLNAEINEVAPQGYAAHREEEAERVRAAAAKLKKAEEERLKAILEHAGAAEDAIRAEMEISEGLSGAGLTAMGEAVFNEARAKEDEQAAEKEARERERLTRKVEQIQESFLSEAMLEEMHYEQQKQILMDRHTEELFGEEEQNRLLEELELQHQARMGNAEAQGILARRRFEEMNAKQKRSFILSEMLALNQGVATSNKTLFKLNQALTLANLAVEMPGAIGAAIERGGGLPWGAVFGIMTAAKYVALMAQAKKADFGTSTSAPSIGGGGATPVFEASRVPDLTTPAQAGPRQLNFYIQSDSGMVSLDWMVNQFAPRLNEAIGDGFKFNFEPA